MAVVYIFKVPRGTKAQYDSVIRKLEETGYGNPDGRLYHFAGPMEGGWQVTDVWESKEKYEHFQVHLAEVLKQLQIPFPDFEVSSADIILPQKTG